MLGFGKKIAVIDDNVIKPEAIMNIKIKDFYLKRSELKTENYITFLYLYSGINDITFDNVIADRSSPEVLKTNPVILVESLNINNEVVFIYKKINDGPMKKLRENALIGSLVYLE